MHIEAKLRALGLELPAPLQPPLGVRLPFAAVRVRGDRAYIAGHGPQLAGGALAGPFGKVGAEVSLEEANALARLTALSVLASLQSALGDLDRVTGLLRVLRIVDVAPRFTRTPDVIHGISD